MIGKDFGLRCWLLGMVWTQGGWRLGVGMFLLGSGRLQKLGMVEATLGEVGLRRMYHVEWGMKLIHLFGMIGG